jgi:ankyrin repeat protein
MTSAQLKASDAQLKQAVHSKDLEQVRLLLEEGAGPDCVESWGDTLLRYLVHEYQTVRTLQGQAVIDILELLLVNGANPDHVGANNWRAIDVSLAEGLPELTEVFIRHGATPTQREFQ